MATGYAIKWLKDKLGVKFFPVTHIKAVRNDNNINLETLLGLKQDELVSGTNIKTVNNTSILGSGNIEVPVPTKTSDLTNDSGFITSADIPEGSAASTTTPKMDGTASVGTEMAFARGDHRHPTDTSRLAVISDLATIRSGASAGATAYLKPSTGIPASDIAAGVIPDVSNFITKSVNDLTNYYTKSLTYTQNEVLQLINAVKQFTYESVSTLPTASSSTMYKIYLVPSSDPLTQNVKDEYITLESSGSYSWEQIGSTAIDLSGYVTTTTLNTTLANYVTSNSLSTTLADYLTKIDSTHKLDYSLLSNTPTIPAAQVNSDWNAASGVAQILNKPTIPAAQVQSDWNEADNTKADYIKNKPIIPAAQVLSDWNQTTTTAKDYIKNKPTIPTVPTISTNITTDASSDSKTASPKAVKTYVDSVKGDTNIIETVKVNGTALTPTNKAVDVIVPTKVSDLTNDSGFIDGMVILSYGSSTWNDFISAYNKNKVVYCRASSNANPATGTQSRLAFMAYIEGTTTPTSVEFQYYRSVKDHTASQQGDQVFVYTLKNTGVWSVIVRAASTKIVAGTGLSSSYSNDTLTITANSFTESDPVFGASAAAGITSSDITNWNGKTSNTGTITGVSVNGTSVATSGVANITSVPASILSGAIPSAVTATTQSSGDKSTKIATTAYVDTAIENLPEPMIFKGSLGTGGTITSLPAAATANTGFTYKVITAGTYASKAAKVGDTFISDGNEWNLIPSGDEPSGTVTSITLKANSPISIDSSAAITTSGTRTLSHANSGVTAGTYRSVTVNETGHVTAGTNPTTLGGYGITDAKISSGTITLGSNTITPLTANSTLDATKLSGTIPASCYTDTNNAVTQTATTTNSAYELLFSGTADNTNRTEGARKTSTLTYNPSTKALVTGGTVNGYTLAAASAKGVDTTLNPNSNTNVPTSKAVADYFNNESILKFWVDETLLELTEGWAIDSPAGVIIETLKGSLYILLEDSENYTAGSIFIWNNTTSLYECIYNTSKDLVISAALNNLNDRLISKTESLESDIYKIIEDDEYVVARAFENLPNDFVTLTSEQIISGIKTFENGWKVNSPNVSDITLELVPSTESTGTLLLLMGNNNVTKGFYIYNKTIGGTMGLRSYGPLDIRTYSYDTNHNNINITTDLKSGESDMDAGNIYIYNRSLREASYATGLWILPRIITFFGLSTAYRTLTPSEENFVNLYGVDLYFSTTETSANNIKAATFNWDGTNLLLRKRTRSSSTSYPYSSLTFNVTGDIIASGTITQGSDIRYKNILNNIEASIEDIAKLPLFHFKWKDERDTETHIGTSAQEVLKLFPELVKEHNELSLDYASLGTIIGILLAKKVSEYEKRIKDLEDKINLLKEN